LRKPTIVKLSLFWTAVAVPIGLLAWASDEITLQGQPTVYTVNFERGEWDGSRCAGKLVPASRYRYKASQARKEESYWVVDAPCCPVDSAIAPCVILATGSATVPKQIYFR